ncbi:MAG: FadR/GntR family transcriptional regulator [Capsulimonadaceae bacterium]|nr:FadR/GntR family transcriptional regulator [Capsulimonadaceae bacterium]
MASILGSFTTGQRRQLVDEVIQRLRERIASGGFPVGAKLPSEPLLMEQFGVGRSTIREAVRVLAHAGLLDVRQGDGTYVRAARGEASLSHRLREAITDEVREVRRALELENGRLAAIRRDDDDLALMATLLAKREEARTRRDSGALVEADVAFHVAIATATKNTLLADIYTDFADVLQTSLSDYATFSDTQAALHRHLLDAIVRRDPDAAASATDQLLERAGSAG